MGSACANARLAPVSEFSVVKPCSVRKHILSSRFREDRAASDSAAVRFALLLKRRWKLSLNFLEDGRFDRFGEDLGLIVPDA